MGEFIPKDDETKQIHRVAGYAFLLNFLLAAVKAYPAVFSGSLAITASAIDSATDAVASLAIYVGVRLSTKKTTSFPLGLHKLENVSAVVIALFIFIAGYEIIREIFSSAGSPPHISLSYILLFLAATVAILIFGQYAMAVGRRTESPALMAEGRHRQVDVLSSLVALLSVSLSYFDLHLNIMGITIDRIGAALILIFIIRAGWNLLSDSMRVLLDASLDFETMDRIRKIISSEPMVDEIRALAGRNAGRFRFVQATITLKTRDLNKAHQVSDRIEKKVRDGVAHLEKVIIHYEPQERASERIALPLADEAGRLSTHFGESPYFGIVDISLTDREVKKREILVNPHRSMKTARGIQVAKWLIDQGVGHVAMKEDISGKGPGYVLSDGGVTVHLVSSEQMDRAVQEIMAKDV